MMEVIFVIWLTFSLIGMGIAIDKCCMGLGKSVDGTIAHYYPTEQQKNERLKKEITEIEEKEKTIKENERLKIENKELEEKLQKMKNNNPVNIITEN